MSPRSNRKPTSQPEASKASPRRASGIVLVGGMPRIADHEDVRVESRGDDNRPVAEKLLRGTWGANATHVALKYIDRPSGPKASVIYRTGGQWGRPTRVPPDMAEQLLRELRQLFAQAEPSCVEGSARTLSTHVGGVGTCELRMHEGFGPALVMSPVRADRNPPSIIDRAHARRRRQLFESGRAALDGGDTMAAIAKLEGAVTMARELGSVAECVRVLLVLGHAREIAQRSLFAERAYKQALRRVQDAYGLHDLQRILIFRRLAGCALARGDESVSEMWRVRAERASTVLEAV